jgi:hypothetical protein
MVKEALEIHERRTGNFLDSFVRLRELVDLDILRVEGRRIVLGAAFDAITDTGSDTGGGSGGADPDASYITSIAEGGLPNSRRLVAGSNVTLDASTPGQLVVSASSGGGGVTAHSALTGLLNDDHTQYVLRNILTTNGDIFAQVAGVVARVGIGTAGQVLTVVGGLPVWADPPDRSGARWVLEQYVDEEILFPNSADGVANNWTLKTYV